MGLFRLWLASAVVLAHAGTPTPLSASLAVSAFYVISGFYIQMIVSETYAGRAGWPWNFYKSRALRIYPTYLIFLSAAAGLCTITGVWQYGMEPFATGNLATKIYYYLSNLFIFGQEIGRFGAYDSATGSISLVSNPSLLAADARVSSMPVLLVSWSIAVELWFYVLAPLLLVRRLRVLLTITALCLLLRVALIAGGYTSSEWWNAFVPTEIGTFCFGALGYRFYAARLHGVRISLVALLAPIVIYSLGYSWLASIHSAWAYAGFVLLTALLVPFIFAVSRRSKIDRFIADLSYPIYIGQFLAIWAGQRFGIATEHNGVFALCSMVCLAAAVVLCIERPLARFRHRRFALKDDESRDISPAQRIAAAPVAGER